MKDENRKIKIVCSWCGNDCGDNLFNVTDCVVICFGCIDGAKEAADDKRKELANKEIDVMAQEMLSILSCADLHIAKSYSRRLYNSGYRKVIKNEI